MKTIKIFLVVVLVAAFGFGIYKVLQKDQAVSDTKPAIVLPNNCDHNAMMKKKDYIDSVFSAIPLSRFDSLISTRNRLNRTYSKIMKNADPECQKTVSLLVLNGEMTRFTIMAEDEFQKTDWDNYKQIESICDSMIEEYSANESEINKENTRKIINQLNHFSILCSQYSELVNFNDNVNYQCNQRPASYYSRWNYNNTMNLIESIPTYTSDTISKTTQYESSRLGNVKNKLYLGHIAFLDSLVRIVCIEVNKKPARKEDIIKDASKEIEKFKDKAYSYYGKDDAAYEKYKQLERTLVNL